MIDVRPSQIDGVGVFAEEDIKAEVVLGTMFWLVNLVPYPTWPRDLKLSKMCWFYNHSTKANCEVFTEDGIVWNIKTVEEIDKDKELLIDYKKLPPFMERSTHGFKETD